MPVWNIFDLVVLTAFKYLVLYFKFNHFALNQTQLYFLFFKGPVIPLWNELALLF